MNKRILIVFISVIILGLAIIGLRLLLEDEPVAAPDPCIGFFTPLPSSIDVGQSFILHSKEGNLSWRILDEEGDEIESFDGVDGEFTMDSAGSYSVEVTSNKGCSEITSVEVRGKEEKPERNEKVEIKGPNRAYVGSNVNFTALNVDANECKWKMPTGKVIKRKSSVSYRFEETGNFEIKLRVDGETYTHRVKVTKRQNVTTPSTTPTTTPVTRPPANTGKNSPEKVKDIITKLIALGVEDSDNYNPFRAAKYRNNFVIEDEICEGFVLYVNGKETKRTDFLRGLGKDEGEEGTVDDVKFNRNSSGCIESYEISGVFPRLN